MLHFLAKLGRHPWSHVTNPMVTGAVSISYLMFHMYGHKIARNFLVARDPNGLNIELTDRVKSLIIDTYNDIGDNLYKDLINIPLQPQEKSQIKWFASSTMEPVTLGMTDAKTGVLIGLPFFFNHTKTMDIPDSMIRFKKLRFFKKVFKDPEGDKIDQTKDQTIFNMNQDLIPPWETTIDRKDPVVKAYLESMILTDDAIRFAIARELYLGDSYRPLLKASMMVACSFFGLGLSRYLVKIYKMRDLHVSKRLSVYAITGLFMLFQYNLVSGVMDRGYTKKVDQLAINSGEIYRRGAKEYFEKLIIRNQSLYKLFEDARQVFTPDGDRIGGYVNRKYAPIEERLSWTEKPEQPTDPKTKIDKQEKS